MSGPVKNINVKDGDKDKNNKLMSFRINDEKLLTKSGVEITIFSGVGHFCRNFLNFIFKNIFCNNNLGGCRKLISTRLLAHV